MDQGWGFGVGHACNKTINQTMIVNKMKKIFSFFFCVAWYGLWPSGWGATALVDYPVRLEFGDLSLGEELVNHYIMKAI